MSRKKPCKCADVADAKLAELNTKIDWAFLINPAGKTQTRLQIKTAKLNPKVRKGPSILVASYCPFCGESLSDDEGVKHDR